MKRQKMSKITDIYSSLNTVQDLQEDIRRYFRYDSRVFDAIIRHIHREDRCLVIYRENPIYSVHFEDAYTSFQMKDSFFITFTVDYHDPEGFSDNCYEKKYTIEIPRTLEQNFTQKAFDTWVKKIYKQWTAERTVNGKQVMIDTIKNFFPGKKARKLMTAVSSI